MKNRQLVINIIAQIVSFLTNMGINFFLTPFIVKNIGREAYGFVGLSNDFINYAQIITVALNSMAGTFITISLSKNDKKATNKYFTTVIVANMILSMILIVPMSFIVLNIDNIFDISVEMISDVRILFSFIFFNFIISILGSVLGIATFAKNRLELAAIRNIEGNLIKVSILIMLLILLKPHVWYIGAATTMSTIFIVYTNSKYTKELLPEVVIKKEYFCMKALKELLTSGVWNSFSKLSSILNSGLNLLIANLYVGANSMGLLSIARTIPNMILSIFAMLSSAFAPQLTISYAKNDLEEIRKQLFLSMKILGLISSIPIVILFSYGDVFYKLWVPDQNYQMLYILSMIIALELIVSLPQETLWNVFTATNKIKHSSIALFVFSICIISTVFIGVHNIEDSNVKIIIIAGASSLFGIIRSLTFLPMYGAKCLGLKWNTFYPLIVKNIISVSIILLISMVIKTNVNINSWIRLIICCLITTTIAIVVNLFIMLRKDERKVLVNRVTKRKKVA